MHRSHRRLGVAERLEALVAKATGRPRELKVRAVLVALLVLALDDRPLHLKAATRLLFCRLPPAGAAPARHNRRGYDQKGLLGPLPPSALPVPPGDLGGRPFGQVKNRVIPGQQLAGLQRG